MSGKIEPGFQVGKLTVLKDTGKRKNGYTIWLCQCSCGKSTELDTRALQRGTKTDCGCETRVAAGQKDITGQRFGRLVALAPTVQRGNGGTVIWRCCCDCGKEALISLKQLTSGYTKSCGCLGHPRLKPLVGKRFGYLTVTEYEGKEKGQHMWRCRCDCGKETVVRQTNLQSGKTRSCGCLQSLALQKNLKLVEGTSVALLEAHREKLVSTNTSGYNGVYLNRRNQKWIAQITFKGKTFYLGSFSDIEQAAEIRKKAEDQIYGDFLKWYYETYPCKKNKKNTADQT